MTYEDIIVVGNPADPGHDYMCNTCREVFELHYRRDQKPAFVICPVCKAGNTQKLVSVPATSVWWRNARASSDAASMRPRFEKPVRSMSARSRREETN